MRYDEEEYQIFVAKFILFAAWAIGMLYMYCNLLQHFHLGWW